MRDILDFNFQGEQGDRGYTGFQGFTGTQGYTGFQGLKGERGDTGLNIPRGYTGFQGKEGSFGGATYEFKINLEIPLHVSPGTGIFKLNNAYLNTSTKLYIDISSNIGNPKKIITSTMSTIDSVTSDVKGFC